MHFNINHTTVSYGRDEKGIIYLASQSSLKAIFVSLSSSFSINYKQNLQIGKKKSTHCGKKNLRNMSDVENYSEKNTSTL